MAAGTSPTTCLRPWGSGSRQQPTPTDCSPTWPPSSPGWDCATSRSGTRAARWSRATTRRHLDPDLIRIPLLAYGTVVGAVHYRPPATPLRSRDLRLLDDLAGPLGGVLHSQRLTRDLQLARERLVLAREEERRRLRRDLHDGLGPALAGHLLRLDVIAARVGRDRAAAADIDSLRHDLRTTVVEVRRVVEGLRPPALDELGLAGALDQVTQRLTAGTPTAVTIQTDRLPPLSAAVEVAAFRIVTEAVTNVVRHAQASTCCIRLSPTGTGSGSPCPTTAAVLTRPAARSPARVADDARAGRGAARPPSGRTGDGRLRHHGVRRPPTACR